MKLQWTCLLTVVCACSAQYLSVEFQRKLEYELGEKTQTLTERYHQVSRELYGIIPPGNGHLYSVQYLLHSCYWYKSEARFTECWYSLSNAIREAQEIGRVKLTQPSDNSNAFSQVSIKKRPCSIPPTLNAKCTDEFGVY